MAAVDVGFDSAVAVDVYWLLVVSKTDITPQHVGIFAVKWPQYHLIPSPNHCYLLIADTNLHHHLLQLLVEDYCLHFGLD